MKLFQLFVTLLVALLVSSIPIQKNPEEGDLFEGDIAGIPRDAKGAFQKPTLLRQLWPKGEVPFIIDPDAKYTPDELKGIYDGVRHLEQVTKVNGTEIVKFLELDPSAGTSSFPDVYIKVIRGNGCYSYIGKQSRKGVQELSIGTGCSRLGTVAHEFLHALGWWHEQSRPDRDSYVFVNMTNVTPGYEQNFVKYSESSVGLLNFGYDYDSVMHYGTTSFSSNGLPTIVPLTPGAQIGQRAGLSFQDADEVKAIYTPNSQKTWIDSIF